MQCQCGFRFTKSLIDFQNDKWISISASVFLRGDASAVGLCAFSQIILVEKVCYDSDTLAQPLTLERQETATTARRTAAPCTAYGNVGLESRSDIMSDMVCFFYHLSC